MAAILDESRLRRVLARCSTRTSSSVRTAFARCRAITRTSRLCSPSATRSTRCRTSPAESDSGMFGGNSNWRGPVWMPVNGLIIRALLQYYMYYGDDFKIECPTGSGQHMTLYEVARELAQRLREHFPARCGRPPPGLWRNREIPDRSALARLPAVLRIFSRRQRRRARRESSDRLDRYRRAHHAFLRNGATGAGAREGCLERSAHCITRRERGSARKDCHLQSLNTPAAMRRCDCALMPPPMGLVTIIWSVAAGAALVLGLVHALVWGYDRRARGNLAFAIAALGLAVGAIFEMQMLHAASPQEWGEWVWWMHIPYFLVVSGMAVFLRLYLGAGRLWLLATFIALRAAILVFNFLSEPSFTFERIDAIAHIPLLGEPVAVAASVVTGQHQWLALLAGLLFPVFIVDVIVTLWRRRTPEATRVALVVGIPVLVSVSISLVMTQLVIWRVVQAPILLIPSFLLALGAMALEASRDVLRASRLARELRESEQRLELAANAAGAGLWAWDSSSGRIWATQRARAILGLPQTGDVDPAEVLKILDASDASELRARLERHGEHALHFRTVAPDGRVHWIAAQGTVEPDARGKLTLVRGVLRDVTQQREAEDDAAELRRKLAHAGRVTMLGQLSSALAHELSQPLSAIQQNAEAAQILLSRDPVDMEEVRAIVADVLRDDRRAAEVVQRLRADARPPGPVRVASTCGLPVTQTTTMSLCAASSWRLAASLAPRPFRSSTGSRLRWATTVSGWPFSTMFLAMPWPISPTPTKPTRSKAMLSSIMMRGPYAFWGAASPASAAPTASNFRRE